MEQIESDPVGSEPTAEEQPNKKTNRTARRLITAVLWVLSVALTATLTYFLTRHAGLSESSILTDALSIIREHYYFYDPDEDHLLDGAIEGMADSLNDVYAEYYSKEEYDALTQTNSGYYTGVGILLAQKDVGVFEIQSVYDDTPAARAGILAGDYLIAINGTAADGLDISTFLTYMKTEDGDENELVLQRGTETLTVTAIAERIYMPRVSCRMLTDTIGYIRLSAFHGECVEEMKNAIEELREQGMQSLVFDLRDNPGGDLYAATDIADLFLSKDLVITSLRSKTEETVTYQTKTEGYVFPMTVLVNGNSGSASELVTGALKDHGRAYIIGTQTYGKGIVQTYLPVTGTGGRLKLTTEAYYTPSGVCIHEVGITPDAVVENPEEAKEYAIGSIPEELDEQLSAAVQYLNGLSAQ